MSYFKIAMLILKFEMIWKKLILKFGISKLVLFFQVVPVSKMAMARSSAVATGCSQ
jgi:hypothetical protein